MVPAAQPPGTKQANDSAYTALLLTDKRHSRGFIPVPANHGAIGIDRAATETFLLQP